MDGIHGKKGVAPAAAKVATAGANKDRGRADERSFTLDGRAEDLADRDPLSAHGRYSAQVRGVSLTRTAETSGHLARHQAKKVRARNSAVTASVPKTSFRCR